MDKRAAFKIKIEFIQIFVLTLAVTKTNSIIIRSESEY